MLTLQQCGRKSSSPRSVTVGERYFGFQRNVGTTTNTTLSLPHFIVSGVCACAVGVTFCRKYLWPNNFWPALVASQSDLEVSSFRCSSITAYLIPTAKVVSPHFAFYLNSSYRWKCDKYFPSFWPCFACAACDKITALPETSAAISFLWMSHAGSLSLEIILLNIL